MNNRTEPVYGTACGGKLGVSDTVVLPDIVELLYGEFNPNYNFFDVWVAFRFEDNFPISPLL